MANNSLDPNAVDPNYPSFRPFFSPRTWVGREFGPKAVGSALVEVARIGVQDLVRLNLEIQNTGSTLSAFQVLGRSNPGGTFQLLFSVTGDYTTPAGLMISASTDLTQLAAGSGYLQMDVTGFDTMVFKATSSGTSTLVVLAGGFNG